MKHTELLDDLKQVPEMNPDEHDGSYELMREIVSSYAKTEDFSACNFKDLNAVYAMAVGTWKMNSQKKKEYVNQSHLSDDEKKRMNLVIDRVWDAACFNKYENREKNTPSIGMFGTGFYSFQDKTTDECSCDFIKMLVDISKMSDDKQIFDRAALVLTNSFKGMGAASASVILHCLKPMTFPILNGNMGHGSIYGALGIELDHSSKIGTYIKNCRKIKEYRDKELPFKNYRILDRWARKVDKYQDDEYIPSLDEYDPGITREKYMDLLTDDNFVEKRYYDTVYYLYKLGGEGTCTQISEEFGDTAHHYNINATYLAKHVYEETKCPLSKREGSDGDRYWAVLFQGRYTKKEEKGVFVWKLRQPLADAIGMLDDEGFFEEFNVEKTVTNGIELNTILYGPPGTGKTFYSMIYAVAIVENKTVDEAACEARTDYDAVKHRYEDYKEAGYIAFTTFHQSYGYEEFIEGIRPVMENENTDTIANDISYEIRNGVFKEFCDHASRPIVKEQDIDFGLNRNPAVWKVSLEGTGDNATRKECLENDHIRIGWDEYGPDINEKTEYTSGGKVVLDAFINKMRIGDLVVSCYSSSETDAIGVIVGDYEWVDDYDNDYYHRTRKVKWLVKNIRESILSINDGKSMTLSSVYKLGVSVNDVLNIVKKYYAPESFEPAKNHVFIIDEINRGNISKIFGELITLIESTKRIGMKEEMTVRLPYSGDEFGVSSNVYILGTMNTADRSIALMDTALRRRFSFVEMMPDAQVLRDLGVSTVEVGDKILDIPEMLETINKRIEYLFDREHTIGHAFFTGLKDEPSIEKLASIFEKSVIPLLQEYFYEDYEKIQLVLGDYGIKKEEDKQYQFIKDTEIKPVELFNNNVPDMEFQNKKFEIQKNAFYKIESYIKISKGL